MVSPSLVSLLAHVEQKLHDLRPSLGPSYPALPRTRLESTNRSCLHGKPPKNRLNNDRHSPNLSGSLGGPPGRRLAFWKIPTLGMTGTVGSVCNGWRPAFGWHPVDEHNPTPAGRAFCMRAAGICPSTAWMLEVGSSLN